MFKKVIAFVIDLFFFVLGSDYAQNAFCLVIVFLQWIISVYCYATFIAFAFVI